MLSVACCLFVVLFVGVCMLFVAFLLLDCGLQCNVCCLLSGADVIIVGCCLLFAACCNYCVLRSLFVVCRLLRVVV